MSDEMELNLKGKLIPPADTLVVKEKGYPDRHFVRNGENYREVTQCKPRNYEVADSESFIKYLSAFAREYAKGGIVVYNHRSITAFFNEETAPAPGLRVKPVLMRLR